MQKFKTWHSLAIGLFLFSLPVAALAGTSTLVSYYPSPNGNYDELRSKKMALGSTTLPNIGSFADFPFSDIPPTDACPANTLCASVSGSDYNMPLSLAVSGSTVLNGRKQRRFWDPWALKSTIPTLDVQGQGSANGSLASVMIGSARTNPADGVSKPNILFSGNNIDVASRMAVTGEWGIYFTIDPNNNAGAVGWGAFTPPDATEYGYHFCHDTTTIPCPAGTEMLTIQESSGNIGIGSTAPAAKLNIYSNGFTSGDHVVSRVNAGTVNGTIDGLYSNIIVSNATTGNITGFLNIVDLNPISLTLNNVMGIYSNVDLSTATGAAITNAYGAYIVMDPHLGVAAITNSYLIKASAGGSSLTYGLYVDAGNGKNYFRGNIGIGTETPSARLSIINENVFINGDMLKISSGGAETGDYLRIKNDGNVGVGSVSPASTLDIKSAGTLKIPNGANPTVSSAGQISVDTSAASGSMVRFYGDAEYGLPAYKSKSFVITKPDTTSKFVIWKTPYAITLRDGGFIVSGMGGTISFELDDYGVSPWGPTVTTLWNQGTSQGTASTVGAANIVIGANHYIAFKVTAVGGANIADYIYVQFNYTVNGAN